MAARRMSRHELVVQVRIDASPARTWAVLTDTERVKQWMDHLEDLHAPKGWKVGTHLEVRVRLGRHAMDSKATITIFDKPSRLAWRHTEDLLDGKPFNLASELTTTFDLAPAGQGTDLQVHLSFIPHGLKAKLGAGYFVRHFMKPQVEASLATLKRMAEAPPPRATRKQT